MKIQTLALTALAASCIFTTQQVNAGEHGPGIQALLGVVRYNNLEVDNIAGTGNEGTLEIDDMVQFGGAWSTAPKGEKLQVGLECSFLMSVKYDDQTLNPTASRTVYVDYNAWMFDLAGGGYVNLFLGKEEKLRIYAAGGPLLMATLFHSEGYETNGGVYTYYTNNENATGYGLYARGGVELRIHKQGLLGVGVRGTWGDLDLSNVSDLSSVGAFLTYTAGF